MFHACQRDACTDHDVRILAFNPLQFRYLLLPIWLLTVVYDSKPFQVYINGVTGEVQGSRPYSKVKIIAAIVAAIIAITAIVILVQSVR